MSNRNKIIQQSALARPWPIASNSVDCVVTSPPYWGLRDYGTAVWLGGSAECDHIERKIRTGEGLAEFSKDLKGGGHKAGKITPIQYRGQCEKCGAESFDEQIGLERTPEAYVDNLVQVFDECRRILKPSGTLWLNLGDTYWGGKGMSAAAWSKTNGSHLHKEAVSYADKGEMRPQDGKHQHIKPKDLVGIPWMVAFALRSAGWYLRQDCIWNKPNPMPESVGDRCTKSHEYLFLLTKSRDYFYDSEAIKEPANYDGRTDLIMKGSDKYADVNIMPHDKPQGLAQSGHVRWKTNDAGEYVRNKRSVWTVPTQGFPGAHFATFPPALIVDCIKAGTSQHGNCAHCGKPWERITAPVIEVDHNGQSERDYPEGSAANRLAKVRQAAREQGMEYNGARKTLGWKATCKCDAEDVVAPIVFDPFMGAATTAVVAQSQGRDWLGLELNPEYIRLAEGRLRSEFGLFHHG